MQPETQINVVWEPIPGSSQVIAINSPCHHTLYHGTRGPGKTITQLMFFKQFVGIGYGKYWRGVIFDVEHKNLDDLVAQSTLFFEQFDDGGRFHKSASGYKWTWPTGEELLFRHIKEPREYQKYHGHQYPFIGWNELTKYPTSELYDSMCSTNRSGFVPELHTPKKLKPNGQHVTDENDNIIYDTDDGLPLPPIPLQVFSTTNPSGPGHNWVKKRFINCAKNGEIVKKDIEVFNPRTKKDEIVTITQIAIFGSYRENIYLDAKYIADLNRATSSDKNLFAAWLLGSWDITAGGALDDVWNGQTHILPRFPIPENWYIDRSFDWGSTHPYSVGWWAQANGEEIILPGGRVFCPPRGSLIQIAELYGCDIDDIGKNKGNKKSPGDIAADIRDSEIKLMTEGWIKTQPHPGPADNQIRSVTRSDVSTIEQEMSTVGVRWSMSDKSPGSRIIGLQLLRDRLEAALKGKDEKHIYFMRNCQASIETLPSLPRDDKKQDDVDTDAEDHAYDMVRYRVLKDANRFAKSIEITRVR